MWYRVVWNLCDPDTDDLHLTLSVGASVGPSGNQVIFLKIFKNLKKRFFECHVSKLGFCERNSCSETNVYETVATSCLQETSPTQGRTMSADWIFIIGI